MRHIRYNPSDLQLPTNWQTEVNTLKTQIEAETDSNKRIDLIKANQKYWKAIKRELAKLFNDKCWYTESKQSGTDVDVDHYRPKGRVAELVNKDDPTKNHDGYWWKAFELENYRYSCIVANRRRTDVETNITGGKADHFPLYNEETRAWSPDDDLDEEQPMLLDPCKATDVALLTFKDDGEPMPRHSETSRPKAYKRAKISIEFYNLSYSDFVNARLELRDEMDELIKEARKYFKKLETGDAYHESAYEAAIKKLMSMKSKKAPYSSFCVAYLDKLRSDEAFDGIFL